MHADKGMTGGLAWPMLELDMILIKIDYTNTLKYKLSYWLKYLLQLFEEHQHISKGVVQWSGCYPHDVWLSCVTLYGEEEGRHTNMCTNTHHYINTHYYSLMVQFLTYIFS